MEKLLAAVVSIVFRLCNILLVALVSTKCWGWFVQPVFGIPTPGMAMMYGLILTVYIPLTQCVDNTNENKMTTDILDQHGVDHCWSGAMKSLGYALIYSLILLEGWIVHLIAS